MKNGRKQTAGRARLAQARAEWDAYARKIDKLFKGELT